MPLDPQDMGRLWHSYFSSCAYTFKISHYAPGIKYLIAYEIDVHWKLGLEGVWCGGGGGAF